MNIITKEFQFGSHTIQFETGRMARQATSAVVTRSGNSMVLTTVVAGKSPTHLSYFPLTVHYFEKAYAGGKIPGGFLKREGRPSDSETLTARLIDRPIRPLFDERFNHDIQIVNTVLSLESGTQADILAMLGTSAALAISGLPFAGPIGAAKVGYSDTDGYILNPDNQTLATLLLDMVVAGTKNAVLMVESEAQQLHEDLMLGAVLYGHQEMQTAISAIEAFAADCGVTPIDWQAADTSQATTVAAQVVAHAQTALTDAYQIQEKQARNQALKAVHEQTETALATTNETGESNTKDIQSALKQLEKTIVRERVLANQPRIDGRDLDTVRPIRVDLGVLPSAHGSALFTRGETQALVSATLGQENNAQLIDSLAGTYKDSFMLHYNFPPFCTGETGMIGSPKRREIGHGNLAKRAIKPVLPTLAKFPYALRIVSEILESNGSSSMASVCGSSLALMDAGVPTSDAVAGIAMGLVKEGDRFAVLTDILGDEDHLGDMDFKVAGTRTGVTALQMDIKIDGISEAIMETALNKAQTARMHILDIMEQAISTPRAELAAHAPRIYTMQIKADKIRDVIGKGGATIQGIIKQTGTEINIGETGEISIFATENDAAQKAIGMIEAIVEEVAIGKVYKGVVKKIVEFGAFVNILPGKDGLVHISQIADERVENVTDYLAEEEEVFVRVLDIDRNGKIKLQYKHVPQTAESQTTEEPSTDEADA